MTHNPDDPEDGAAPSSDGDDESLTAEAGGGHGGGGDRAPPQGDDDDGDEEPVGYCRPPKKHRFQPGASGNSKGRPRAAKGLKTILRKELSERVRITENGQSRSISKIELMVKRLVEKGGKGDFRSIEKLISLGAEVFGMDDESDARSKLSAHEQAIIDQLAARREEHASRTAKPFEEPENPR